MMKRLSFQLCFVFLMLFISTAFGQATGPQAPPYLIEEMYRLSQDCYYFNEYRRIEQSNQSLILVTFLNREAVQTHARPFAGPVSTCGKRPQQVRLYRLSNENAIEFKDSVLIHKFSIALGSIAYFREAESPKFFIEHVCRSLEGTAVPLLCHSLSLYEITKGLKLRNLVVAGNVPEHYVLERPQGSPLEPVVVDYFDKSPYPQCIAVDDFFEGDAAFRSDDFPNVSLVYAWDTTAQTFVHRSDRFVRRFSLPLSLDSIPADISLVDFMKDAMSIAAIGKQEQALHYIDVVLTKPRTDTWKANDKQRAQHIDLDRLRRKLLTCIARYAIRP